MSDDRREPGEDPVFQLVLVRHGREYRPGTVSCGVLLPGWHVPGHGVCLLQLLLHSRCVLPFWHLGAQTLPCWVLLLQLHYHRSVSHWIILSTRQCGPVAVWIQLLPHEQHVVSTLPRGITSQSAEHVHMCQLLHGELHNHNQQHLCHLSQWTSHTSSRAQRVWLHVWKVQELYSSACQSGASGGWTV